MDFFWPLFNIKPENEMFKNTYNSLSIESLWLRLLFHFLFLTGPKVGHSLLITSSSWLYLLTFVIIFFNPHYFSPAGFLLSAPQNVQRQRFWRHGHRHHGAGPERRGNRLRHEDAVTGCHRGRVSKRQGAATHCFRALLSKSAF